jgi:hypothetical protein
VKSEFLAKSPLLILPLGALFVFIGVFVAILFVTMKRRSRTYDPIAQLPLEDEGGPQ